jgi:hypothetical protein
MPRGNPKKPVNLRMNEATLEAIRATGVPFTQAIEEAVALWLARTKQRLARDEAQRPVRKRRTA